MSDEKFIPMFEENINHINTPYNNREYRVVGTIFMGTDYNWDYTVQSIQKQAKDYGADVIHELNYGATLITATAIKFVDEPAGEVQNEGLDINADIKIIAAAVELYWEKSSRGEDTSESFYISGESEATQLYVKHLRNAGCNVTLFRYAGFGPLRVVCFGCDTTCLPVTKFRPNYAEDERRIHEAAKEHQEKVDAGNYDACKTWTKLSDTSSPTVRRLVKEYEDKGWPVVIEADSIFFG